MRSLCPSSESRFLEVLRFYVAILTQDFNGDFFGPRLIFSLRRRRLLLDPCLICSLIFVLIRMRLA